MTLHKKNIVLDIYMATITRASMLRTAKCHDRDIGCNDYYMQGSQFMLILYFLRG